MQKQNLVYRAVVLILEISASILLMGLMLLTCVDVVGRYFFNSPIWGGFEMTEALLATLIFMGLPLVTLRADHIDIDMLSIPKYLERANHVAVNLICLVATAYLSYRLWLRGDQLMRAGETTLQLGVPLGYIAHAMSVLTALTAVAFLIVALLPPPRRTALVSDI